MTPVGTTDGKIVQRDRAFDLFVESGPDAGRRFALGDRVTIGTHPSNAIVLIDPAVAPFHGTLEFLGARPLPKRSEPHAAPETGPRFTAPGNGRPPTDAPPVPPETRLVATWRFHGLPAPPDGAASGALLGGVRVMDAEVHELAPIAVGNTRFALVGRERFAVVAAFERGRRTDVGGRERTGPSLKGPSSGAERLAVAVARAARQRAPVVLHGPARARAAVALEFAKDRARTGLFSVGAGPDPEQRLERAFSQASAAEGVVFVDDVDQLPLLAQAVFLKLLREFEGVRVVVGSALPLAPLVAEGRFRRDLRDRLSVIVLELPARAPEPPQPFAAAKAAVVDAFERSYATTVLAWSDGHVARAAKKSGLNRASLYRLLERLERAR